MNTQQAPSTIDSALALQEIRIELLRNCPLLCLHCSAYAAAHHTLQLPLKRVLSLIEEFASSQGHRITFTGGEPLMYEGIEEVLHQCRKYELKTRLFSTGIVLENEERIVGNKILQSSRQNIDTIMYSVYSANADIHDQITRIPGSFRLTTQALEQTIALGIGAEIHFVPTRANHRDLPQVIELANRLKVPRVGILRFVPHGRGKSRADTLTLTRIEQSWLRNTIIEARIKYPQIDLQVGSAYNLLGVNNPLSCNAGINQLVIEADGNIVPCSAFSNFHVNDSFGNVLQQPLQTIWKQSEYLKQVRQALTDSHDCHGCLAQKTIAAGFITSYMQDPFGSKLQ